jgi:hypothetical protein
MSVMTHACPTWEYAADAQLLKLQRLQNRVLHAIGNLDRCTPFRELHVVFKIPYVYDCITKLCRTQAEIVVNFINPNVRCAGQEKLVIGSIRGSNLASVKPTTVQPTNCSVRVVA